MDCRSILIAASIAAILVLLSVLILAILRREKSKKRVRRMEMPQKIHLLNQLAEPFGFFYIEEEDVFTSRVDAWQRHSGYTAMYDKAAAGANMVMDAFPVYFDFEGKTWLIEFWKGQYGINTGGEVGVYHARHIVPPYFYPAVHFEAAEDDEMPRMLCCLERKEERIYELFDRHWWLTGFRMGTFSKPRDLRMAVEITFDEAKMAEAFFKGLQKTGLPRSRFRICCNEVWIKIDFSGKRPFFEHLHRACVQRLNHFYCLSYRAVTRPFVRTADRMLFLYFQLPFCFRRMLRLGCGRFRKKYRGGGGCPDYRADG